MPDVYCAMDNLYQLISPRLDEKQRRELAGAISLSLGHGGVKWVVTTLHKDPKTVARGRKEVLEAIPRFPALTKAGTVRIRLPGGGRHPMEKVCQGEQGIDLKAEVLALLENDGTSVVGNPMNPLKWISKTLVHIQTALSEKGIYVSVTVIHRILIESSYSLQKNRKYFASGPVPEWRNAQFLRITADIQAFRAAEHAAIISVDALSKLKIGPYANNGQEWCRSRNPVRVNDHDFQNGETRTVTPYGIYDMKTNTGYVTIGLSHDTPMFAASCICRYIRMKQKEDPQLERVLILCDGGGSNSSRSTVWKGALQVIATRLGVEIVVRHYPPYCSKYNPIEHHCWPYLVKNMRAHPLYDVETVANLISHTSTSTGFTAYCTVDEKDYPLGVSLDKKAFKEELTIQKEDFHPEINYSLLPNRDSALLHREIDTSEPQTNSKAPLRPGDVRDRVCSA